MLELKALVLALVALAAWAGAGTPSTAEGVAYVGCSNTTMSVLGYHQDGGTRLWNTYQKTYSGGTIVRWAGSTGGYWQQFDYLNRTQPDATSVWMQLCLHATDTASQVEKAAVVVIGGVHNGLPGVPVYVSPINGYDGIVCSDIGGSGSAVSATAAAWVVANGYPQTGPEMPALTASTTIWDHCHPNTAGQALLGQALLAWLGS